MRLRYCDGKDKYFPHTRIKDVEKYFFDKTACQTLNSVSRMVNFMGQPFFPPLILKHYHKFYVFGLPGLYV